MQRKKESTNDRKALVTGSHPVRSTFRHNLKGVALRQVSSGTSEACKILAASYEDSIGEENIIERRVRRVVRE